MRAEKILSNYIKGDIDRDYHGYEGAVKKLDYYSCSLRMALRAIREGMRLTRKELKETWKVCGNGHNLIAWKHHGDCPMCVLLKNLEKVIGDERSLSWVKSNKRTS